MIAEAAGVCEVGLAREAQEDGLGLFPEEGLVAVIDGMGGNVAGSAVPPLFLALLRAALREAPEDMDATEALRAALVTTNARLLAALEARGPTYRGTGGAAAVCWARGPSLVLGSAGDCRVYRWRDGALVQLTTDHDLKRALVEAGSPEVSQEQLETFRTVITMAFAVGPTVNPDVFLADARDGDLFLVCSDGLWRTLPDASIAEVLARGEGLAAGSHALRAQALARGTYDNVTVGLFRWRDGAAGRVSPGGSPGGSGASTPRSIFRREAEVRARLRDLTDPEEAWERCLARGDVRPPWSGERLFVGARRAVQCAPEDPSRVRERLRAQGNLVGFGPPGARPPRPSSLEVFALRAVPWTLEAVALAASDPAGFLAAEALALEALARWWRWGCAAPQRVLWDLSADAPEPGARLRHLLGAFTFVPGIERGGTTSDASGSWAETVGRWIRDIDARWHREDLGDLTFRELPNPVAPLGALLDLGVLLEDFTEEGVLLRRARSP
ncbi:MAG: serine/threonine-protein phosphatase [Deltaproteobacteria bacterium]|nr:serine/threonine-protein phosphatase [Deltaproteobacteria bacterium]